jgi:hypothetical protein
VGSIALSALVAEYGGAQPADRTDRAGGFVALMGWLADLT